MKFLDFLRKGKSAISTYTMWRAGLPFTGSKLRGSFDDLYPSKYLLDFNALRTISRRNTFESDQARAITNRLDINVIGTGLKLSCTPTWELVQGQLSWTDEEKQKFTREIELRFFLWANSHEPDSTERMSLGELQSYMFSNLLKDGETFIILRYSPDKTRISPLSLQFINPDQIWDIDLMPESQIKLSADTYQQDGIEFDLSGKPLAIYVRAGAEMKIQRVPFRGTERTFVLHPAIITEIGQVRGVSPVAMIAHDLEKLTDYSVAEVEAAVNNALIAGWIKPSDDANSSHPFAALAAQGAVKDTGNDKGPTRVDKAGFWIQNLKAGEEMQSFDTKRPNVNFGTFVDSVCSYLTASLGIPLEITKMMFNQNYSASRAALILYWQTVEKWRASIVSQFLHPVYKAWFSEEVKAGRINAPGFGDSPLLTEAWLTADWIGSSLPSIDPRAEAEADTIRLQQGATTYERNALKYNGSDFRDNCEKQKKEKSLLADTGEVISDGQ